MVIVSFLIQHRIQQISLPNVSCLNVNDKGKELGKAMGRTSFIYFTSLFWSERKISICRRNETFWIKSKENFDVECICAIKNTACIIFKAHLKIEFNKNFAVYYKNFARHISYRVVHVDFKCVHRLIIAHNFWMI